MSRYFDLTSPDSRQRGLLAAVDEIGAGRLVVFPTDTTYGLGCDAFAPGAVSQLRRARAGSRSAPPAVLVAHVRTLDGITTGVSDAVRALAEAFWPGALTLICRSQPTLDWDLGDSNGTVAVRMPLHPVALELLERTGPLAVSSANHAGQPSAVTCQDARDQLGESVSVYLDAGLCGSGVLSTIIDGTQDVPRVLRLGALSVEELALVVPELSDVVPVSGAGAPERAG